MRLMLTQDVNMLNDPDGRSGGSQRGGRSGGFVLAGGVDEAVDVGEGPELGG